EHAPPLGGDSQGEACPTVSGFEAEQDRANIIKTSTLPSDSTPRARIKLLEDRDGGGDDPSREDATIKGRSLETGEEAEVATVNIPPTGEILTVSVPTDSGVVPTASPIFTTATMATPYSRKKERIELINDLVKYKDNYVKVLKYQSQQRKPLSKKQQREFYMSVLRSHAGWKTKHFKGMSLKEIREKFVLVWKQIEDFVPMGSKEEGERMKRKGLRLEQVSPKKVKTSEEVSEEDLKEMMQLVQVEEVYVEALQVKHLIIDWEIHTEGQRSYWKIIRLGGSTTSYQFFVDMLKHFNREDLNQLWASVKQTLNIKQATSDKEKELWVELKRLYEADVED
nr:hypothetical protein [Tanacetum cinerariifolium]